MSVNLEELALQLLQQLITGQQNQSTAQQIQQLQIGVNQAVLDAQAASITALEIQQLLNTDLPELFVLIQQANDQLRTLQAILGNPQQAGIAVRLPTTPPPGYGANNGDIATAVWEFPQPAAADELSGDLLAGAGLLAVNAGAAKWEATLGLEPGWLVRGSWASEATPPHDQPDQFNVSLILPTDTSVTQFLNRVYGSGYTADAWGRAHINDSNTSVDWEYISQWGQLEFDQWQALASSGTSVRVPPVWPGLAHVTLGTTIALADGLTVPGPLDGVVISVTSVAPPTGFYPFGAIKSYVHLGGIVFVTDRGDAEESQGIGPQVQVIVPSMIQHPDHAIIRLKTGTVGTVTPWVVV